MKFPRYVHRTWRKTSVGWVYDLQDHRNMISCCSFTSRRKAEIAYAQALRNLRSYRKMLKSIKASHTVPHGSEV